MKKLLGIISISLMILSFSSCLEPGYVTDEPTYIEVPRPASPGGAYIWIEGDWVWNRQSHNYFRRGGNWVLPRQGRAYSSGYWQQSHRGRHWVSGRWN